MFDFYSDTIVKRKDTNIYFYAKENAMNLLI